MRFWFPSSAISMYSISRHEATAPILICQEKRECAAFLSRTEKQQFTIEDKLCA